MEYQAVAIEAVEDDFFSYLSSQLRLYVQVKDTCLCQLQ
jgi:hypothetical protein